MSASEFGTWLAFFEEEAIGPGVHVALWAELMAALHNGPATRKDKRRWQPEDFARPRWAPPAAPVKASTKGSAARAHIAALKARAK
jgi:hypothetical protein